MEKISLYKQLYLLRNKLNIKKFLRVLQRFTAVLATAAVTFSAVGIYVSAGSENAPAEPPAAEALKYTGWSLGEKGWQYLDNGVPYKGKPYKIDGVWYDFSDKGYCTGEYWGWSKTERYYRRGVPYTGEEELYELNDHGYYDPLGDVYCINGYPMKGGVRIKDEVHYFDKNVIDPNEGSIIKALAASCVGGTYYANAEEAAVELDEYYTHEDYPEVSPERISADAEEIEVTVIVAYSSGDYIVSSPEKMERLENGEWKSCGNPSEYVADDIERVVTKTYDSLPYYTTVTFYPKRYMGGNMPAGFYRILIPCRQKDEHSETKEYVCAVFEAVPPIEASVSEEPYLADNNGKTEISFTVSINSAKKSLQPEALADSLKLELMKKTVSGWEYCKVDGYSADCTDNENKIKVNAEFTAEAGYYKAVLNVGGKDYSVPFRTVYISAVPWLDEYSLKSSDTTVIFTLHNQLDETAKICTDLTDLYKKENGKWTDMHGKAARYGRGEKDLSYIFLNAYEKTSLCFDLSELYDTSKLEAGDYAVFIGGVGYAEFKLTDEEPKSDDFPFIDIKDEDVKEIKFLYREYGRDYDNDENKVRASFKNGSCFERSLDYLRYMKFEKVYQYYINDDELNDWLEVTVRLNGGRKKTLLFLENKAVIYNGNESKVYKCSKNTYSALYDFLLEANGLETYWGYRRYQ